MLLLLFLCASEDQPVLIFAQNLAVTKRSTPNELAWDFSVRRITCFLIVIFALTLQNPNDIAYVFSGYAPLTVRLAQFLARPQGWRGLEEVKIHQRTNNDKSASQYQLKTKSHQSKHSTGSKRG